MSRVLRDLPAPLLALGGSILGAFILALGLRALRRGRPPPEAWSTAAIDGILVGAAALVGLATLTSRGRGSGVDLSPFHEIAAVLADPSPRDPATWRLVGNLALFAPFGALLPLRWRPVDGWGRVLVACAAASIAIEGLQFALRIGRTAALDDVLLNAAGGGLGYALLALARGLVRWRGRLARTGRTA